MKYQLYGELDFSPISIKTNNLLHIQQLIQNIRQLTICSSWYCIYKVYENKPEELIQTDLIKGV